MILRNQECKFDRRTTKALSLKLVSKLVLYTVAFIVGIFRDFDLDLDANGLEGVHLTDINLFRYAKFVLAASKNEIGIVWPLQISIIYKDKLLFNGLT